MKKFLPLLTLVLALGYVGAVLVPPHNTGAFDLVGFGRLPVLVNGRIKPLDTVARTSLLIMQGRQAVSDPTLPEPMVASPTEWLADVLFAPAKADDYPTFRVSSAQSPELVELMGLTEEQTKISYKDASARVMAVADFLPRTRTRFSFNQLAPKLAELDKQYQLAEPVDAAKRTPFQREVLHLHESLVLYQRLQHSLVPPGEDGFLADLLNFQKQLPQGIDALRAKQENRPHDEALEKQMIEIGNQFMTLDRYAYVRAVPPAPDAKDQTAWSTTGAALLEAYGTGQVDPTALVYAALAQTWRQHQPEQFNHLVEESRKQLEKRFASQLAKSDFETKFNAAEPFYRSTVLYAFAFFVAIFSWLKWPDVLGRCAFYLVLVAFLTATAGIATRMWLEGRPPVTNLYSSALFVGWGAAGLCLILEQIYRNGIGSAAAGVVGFLTLLIAHHLSLSGDTLEMMRAVLDTNLWLATHVVIVVSGYAATFLSGFLALIYIFRGLFTRSLDKATADTLARMVYGIVCFATLCSLIGTILGGIWADQSWGRFWGWDPKENGALIIVIWNAIILHARWGGMVKQRGLMCLAVFGNIVTSWSWFGVNMLGIGLHSYGFMDEAFAWLVAFVVSQLAIIGLANLPLEKWRSFKAVVPRAAAPVAVR
ncbi:MAG TPA: cytochrome c biogenesis protein CcsA [Opitutaceae bacterium]|nr:cytochrome c biogenesis protein CcsA [Opitutaceae bacterium]